MLCKRIWEFPYIFAIYRNIQDFLYMCIYYTNMYRKFYIKKCKLKFTVILNGYGFLYLYK